jgi:hypothetical protein
MNVDEFRTILKPVTDLVSTREISQALTEELNEAFPPGGETFDSIESACHDAIAAGWMCAQGSEGRRFGRVIEPTAETDRLSVDVVELKDIVGPHHSHPNGEVCMVMPVDEGAKFDGKPRGWCTYDSGSDHHPTVTDGKALVLYLLPEGKIEFTGR